MVKNLNEFFNETMISKGLSYFERNCVQNISSKEGKYKAIIHGSKYYNVTIEVFNNKIINSTCDGSQCGVRCNHMAALAVAIQNNNDNSKDIKELEVILNRAKKEELIDYIISSITSKEQLLLVKTDFIKYNEFDTSTFENLFGDVEFNRFDFEEDYDHEIIPGNDLLSSISCLFNYLTRLIKVSPKDCFQCMVYLYEQKSKLYIDDYDFSWWDQEFDHYYKLFEKLFDNDDLMPVIFDWIEKQLLIDSDFQNFYLEKYIDSEYLKLKKEYIIKNENYLLTSNSFFTNTYIALAKQVKISDEELEKTLSKYDDNYKVYKYLLDYYQKTNNHLKLIKLINNAKNRIDVDELSLLITAYSKLNDFNNAKLTAKILLKDTHDIKKYHQIKELFTKEEWSIEKKDYIKLIRNNELLKQVYYEEEEPQLLFELVTKQFKNCDIKLYGNYLVKYYQKELFDLIIFKVLAIASLTGEVNYHQVNYLLTSLDEIEGSQELVIDALDQIMQLYKHRRLMKQILSSLFNKYAIY